MALACTDFRIKARDNTLIVTRSMEFAYDMHSRLMTARRDQIFTNKTPSGKDGLSWHTKYGYVFLDGLDTGIALDGMNENGLAIEALYLPGETQYQNIPANKESRALAYFNFCHWILGNFKSIDEVKQALPTVYVYAQPLAQANNIIFPLHFSITDNTGAAIVIEFIGGQMQVHDNIIGVFTNSPTYDWHLSNLRNYVNLTPLTPQPVITDGLTFSATGQGAGMIGLPGDISPPSRFVKVAIMLKTILTPTDADHAINMAEHIINNVDIPLGFVRESQKMDISTNELTQWVVFKDLTHKMFYYRTYNDLTLHVVDLSKISFSAIAPALQMPIASAPYVIDMTSSFMNSGRNK
jgi:choloylglycine hydrolase